MLLIQFFWTNPREGYSPRQSRAVLIPRVWVRSSVFPS